MASTYPIPVTFYTKPGCHLCEDVEEFLATLASRWSLQITPVNILEDVEVHHKYWDKIPVVHIGDQLLQAPIKPHDLQRAVIQAFEKQK
jgi:glutaredoxin